jgi:ABC-type enterochelin transport system ATPase subunit
LIMKNGSLLTLGPIEHTLNATLLTRAFDLPLQVVKLKHRKVIIK